MVDDHVGVALRADVTKAMRTAGTELAELIALRTAGMATLPFWRNAASEAARHRAFEVLHVFAGIVPRSRLSSVVRAWAIRVLALRHKLIAKVGRFDLKSL